MWNQSSQCSDSGLRSLGSSRTVSPPSVRNTTRWFACRPCAFSTSNSRRFGLVSTWGTNAKHFDAPSGFRTLPAITSKHRSVRDTGWRACT